MCAFYKTVLPHVCSSSLQCLEGLGFFPVHAHLCGWMRGIKVTSHAQTQISMGVVTSMRPPGEPFSRGIRS